MKKIVYTLLVTLSGLVLLFSYRTSTQVVAATGDDVPPSDGTTGGSASPGGTGGESSAVAGSETSASSSPSASARTENGKTSDSTKTSGYADGTYTGAAVGTRYGAVQVKMTVTGGTITAVTAVQYPNSNPHDQAINSRAIPVLAREAMSAQSANIDMVSGATYTSTGYLGSLQDAIDQASR